MNPTRKEEKEREGIRAQSVALANTIIKFRLDYGIDMFPEILQYLQEKEEEQ